MVHRNAIAICLSVLVLVGVGMIMLTSTSMWIGSDATRYALVTRQGKWLCVGVLVAWFLANRDYRSIRKHRGWLRLAFSFCVLLLILVYLPGIGKEVNGEQRWIQLPGLVFQPSEIGKIMTIIMLCAWYAHYQAETRGLLNGFLMPSILLGGPTLLIFFEKDMGTAAGLGAAGLSVMFIAGCRLRYLIPSIAVALGGFAYLVFSNANRMQRITAFWEPEEHKSGFFYQQLRGLIAFGNGGIEGVGIGNGAEKHGYLPFPHTDFIFPMVGEELGWVTLVVVFCFVIYTVFGLLIAMQARDMFGRLLAVGLTTIVVIPAMVNMGVTTAVLPNTGLPLPFVSYGGTNLVVTIASVGLLLSVHRASKVDKTAELLSVKKSLIDTKL